MTESVRSRVRMRWGQQIMAHKNKTFRERRQVGELQVGGSMHIAAPQGLTADRRNAAALSYMVLRLACAELAPVAD